MGCGDHRSCRGHAQSQAVHLVQGGVGRIAEELVAGLQEHGGRIEYRANAREIVTSGSGDTMKAVGVRLADGPSLQVPLMCLRGRHHPDAQQTLRGHTRRDNARCVCMHKQTGRRCSHDLSAIAGAGYVPCQPLRQICHCRHGA